MGPKSPLQSALGPGEVDTTSAGFPIPNTLHGALQASWVAKGGRGVSLSLSLSLPMAWTPRGTDACCGGYLTSSSARQK